MALIASMVLLAFAVSLDGFGVGMTYGIRRIRLPVLSVVIISLCSGLVLYVAMRIGTLLQDWLPPHYASIVGAVILIGIGLVALAQFIRSGEEAQTTDDATDDQQLETTPTQTVFTLELRMFGIIIQILRKPSTADMDRSGVIGAGEAILLGTALSLDAFGAGIGAALVGFPSIPMAVLIMVASGTFLWMGRKFGQWASHWRYIRKLSALPGIIMIAMGIFKLF